EHLLALGPTGSGKSSGLAIPAILEWPGPVVVTDPKGELVSSTLAHRRRLGRVAIFAPLMRPSAAWNPVASIASSEDALRVATFLMSRPPEREPFWHDLARQLLHGMLIEASQQGLTLARLLESLQVEPAETLAAKLSHPVARRLAQGALSGGERTAMGVVATLVSQLGAYGSDQVAQATAESDFDPKAMAGGGLGTLYCVVAPHDAPVLRGLVSALISCCWRGLFAAPPQPPALFVLDEFTQLTNLPELPALAQLGRSQGVRLLLMAQDLGSITATYGREAAGALWSNCATKLLLPGISELELLERVSKLAGTTTLHRGEGELSRQPVASHPLLQPDDVRRLRPGRALLLHGGDQPALIQQHRWFQDRALRRLVLPPPGGLLPAPAPGRPLRDWIEPTMAREAPTDSLRWQGGETTAA
ncbi:MAG: type IV secretory system conjugative DNA transfer family protein, partial [Candidatus Dormibacteria bacterium]